MDSVRIFYSEEADGERTTPALHALQDTVRVRVLGLRANASYLLRAEGWRRGQLIEGDTATFTTDSLPAPLRVLDLDVTAGTPTGSLVVLPALIDGNGYLVAFDSTSTIRWYFDGTPYRPGSAPADFKQLPNGNFVMFLGATRGWDATFGRFYEVDVEGRVVRTYSAAPPLYNDNHEILLEFADSVPVAAMFFTYDIRMTDLTTYGGAPSVALAGHQLVRQQIDGTTDFFFNAWDHFSLLDWIEEPQGQKMAPTADWDHPNSLDLDPQGNYVVSWRNMGEVTKIDRRTGAVIWRWGGRNNQFTFVDDPWALFSGQHHVQVLPSGNYLVYDNGHRHTPSETRIAEYRLDETALTATLVWEYRRTPAIFTAFLGSVSRLSNGNTFIGWGDAGLMREVRADKSVVWDARTLVRGGQMNFYRALRVPSLYTVQRP